MAKKTPATPAAIKSRMLRDMANNRDAWQTFSLTMPSRWIAVDDLNRVLWQDGDRWFAAQLNPHTGRPLTTAGDRPYATLVAVIHERSLAHFKGVKAIRLGDYCQARANACEAALKELESMLGGGASENDTPE